jgi:hypothetical protein
MNYDIIYNMKSGLLRKKDKTEIMRSYIKPVLYPHLNCDSTMKRATNVPFQVIKYYHPFFPSAQKFLKIFDEPEVSSKALITHLYE